MGASDLNNGCTQSATVARSSASSTRTSSRLCSFNGAPALLRASRTSSREASTSTETPCSMSCFAANSGSARTYKQDRREPIRGLANRHVQAV